MDRDIVVIAHDIRSCHNVGSLFRTAEGIGVSKLYMSGYSPYPLEMNDERLPHESAKIAKQINKTALGTEETLPWTRITNVKKLINDLRSMDYVVTALEQSSKSIDIKDWQPAQKVAILIGREVEGIESDLLNACDCIVEIPMFGKKESYNVVQATAMILFRLRFLP